MCDGQCSRPHGPERAVPDGTLRIVGASRREFIGQATLAAIAAPLTGACGDGQIGGAGPAAPVEPGARLTIRLADYPALQQVGGIAHAESAASNPIAVTRLGQSSSVALSWICPHRGYKPMSITSSGFVCPSHEAQFASDGAWIGGPQTSNLQSYPVAYNAGAETLTIG